MSESPARASTKAKMGHRPRLRSWRVLTRALVLVAGVLLLGPLSGWSSGPSVLGALSPFVATGSILASRSLHSLAWLGLLVGVWVVVRRRLFCRWVCPTGLLLDGVGKLGCACGRQQAKPGKLGGWLVWLTLGGAIFGLPLFLWLDPLAIFSAAASIPCGDAGLARWYAGGMVAFLLLLGIVRPGSWCRQVCPLGAFQGIMHDGPRSIICGLRGDGRASPDGMRSRPISRRAWLGLAGGGVSAVALPAAATRSQNVLRPPGALGEPSFNGVCLRCGDCVRACPSGIIRNAGTEAGWVGLFTPTVSFGEDYCREDCVRCTEVCPSGALRRVSLAGKEAVQIGLPKVNFDLCLLADERECSQCRDWCPYGAIRYVFSEDDYLVHPQVDPERCNGCGACEVYCPVSPAKAIAVESVGGRR